MDKTVAVKVENLSKIYKLYQKASDQLIEMLPFVSRRATDFHALKDISFELQKGDFLGVVGRNGAGKSTLLKILSGVVTPTSGTVKVNGVVSLLQLGTGFNPELTGRENAIFASKILGFSNKEIEKILPQIIEFAEIGDFIDQPIKTYSSGMHSRLSFAVGINVDPDILIADEVLSVGDMRFSQKCLRKMHEFKEMGKTLILVTHDTTSVALFCNKAIWILDGQIYESGDAKKVAENYKNYMLYGRDIRDGEPTSSSDKSQKAITQAAPKIQIHKDLSISSDSLDLDELSRLPHVGDHRGRILRGNILHGETLKPCRQFAPHESFYLVYESAIYEQIKDVYFGYLIHDKNGLIALHSNNVICAEKIIPVINGDQKVTTAFKITLPALNTGQFLVSISVFNGEEPVSRLHDLFNFEVRNTGVTQKQLGYVFSENDHFYISELQ